MKLFSCSSCGQIIFFEDVRCTKCGSALAYLPDQSTMGAMVATDGALTSTLPLAKGMQYRLCQNSIEHGVCNWAVPSLNRGMGLLDLYPFVLSERAIDKLRFVHDVIERARVST